MLVPGVRIVRGPDWSWDNQGMNNFTFYFEKSSENMYHKLEIIFADIIKSHVSISIFIFLTLSYYMQVSQTNRILV